jgi:AcrR family transcriptional regulator
MGATIVRDDPRESILDAADRRFRHYGYRKTTVEEIANEAGLSRGTVYIHFGSKDELAVAWIGRFLGARKERLSEIARLPGTAEERLRLMLVERVLFAFDGAMKLSESLDDLLYSLRVPLMECREKHHEEEAHIVAGVIDEGNVGSAFRANDALASARLVILATNSLLPYNLSPRQLGRREEIEVKAKGLAEILVRGLKYEVRSE